MRRARMRTSRIPKRAISHGIEIPLDDGFVTLEREMKRVIGEKDGQAFINLIREGVLKIDETYKDIK